MEGFEVKFNVYANSEEEAEQAAKDIRQFISELAVQGRAVTAEKLSQAVRKYKNNYFVINYFN